MWVCQRQNSQFYFHDSGIVTNTPSTKNNLGYWKIANKDGIEISIDDTNYEIKLNHQGRVQEGMIATGSQEGTMVNYKFIYLVNQTNPFHIKSEETKKKPSGEKFKF